MSIRPLFDSFSVPFAILLFITSSFGLSAQNFFPNLAPIYKDDIVARVDITIPEDSLTFIVAPGNEESEYNFHATFIFDNGTIRDTFEDVGFQLRGNTSRYAKKKSFQVSLNTYVPGRTWHGIEKINLNGEHNDPTVSRSKIAWDLLRNIGVPAPRSSHVELFINERYYGLYANVEHIDEEFAQTRFGNKDGNLYKCLWPADMKYLGSDPDLYKLYIGNKRVYELKTNEDMDDYSDLAHLIDVLNNTPVADMPCELEPIFNINSFLKCIAFDIFSGNWDGPLYNKNNFYLYHNEATGKFEYIPFDLDNTFGIDWFGINWSNRNIYNWGHPDEPRPLYWRILDVPEYRKRFSYFFNQILNDVYKESILFPRIDALRALLAPSISDDEFYTMDYGFSVDDFNKGFGQSLPYFHTPKGIKPFIATRRSSAIQQLQLEDIHPIVDGVTVHYDMETGKTAIRAFVEDDQELEYVQTNFQINGAGPIDVLAMYDDGQHLDGDASDGHFGVWLPSFDTTVVLHYSILASDIHGHESQNPTCGTYQLVAGRSPVRLSINEFMASNLSVVNDDFGEYEDWVEIYNYGIEEVYLGELYLSDKRNNPTKWQFPEMWIEAGTYLLIWLDEDGNQGPLHANFKLSAGGEFVGIFAEGENENLLIDGLDFGPQETDAAFGRFPNGTGPFVELYPTPGMANQQITSTESEPVRMDYSIYPNPVHDELYIKLIEDVRADASVTIYNLQGAKLYHEKMQVSEKRLDMSGWPEGMYLIRVFSKDKEIVTKKVIKM